MTETILTILPVMVCGVMAAVTALSLYDRWDRPRARLFVFLLTACLLYVGHFVFFNRQTEAIPLTDTIYCFCNPAVYPLYYLYIEELTQYRPNRWKQSLLLLPAVVCFILVGTLYLLMDAEETALFIDLHLYHDEYLTLTGLPRLQAVAHAVVKLVHAVQIPFVLIYGFKRITQYNKVVDANYSNTEDKLIVRVKPLLVLLAMTSVASFVCNLVGRYQFEGSILLLTIPMILFSTMLLLMGYVGLNQHFHIQDIDQDALEMPEPVMPEKMDSKLLEEIKHAVINERLFLQPNLKISDLATRLHTNRNYIYNAINVEMGISFSDYINQQRIEYAAALLEQDPDKPISEIQIQSGFTSSSAFYRNFKKFKGSTPRETILELHEEKTGRK